MFSGLAWTVALKPEERSFIGRGALENQKREGIPQQLVGLVLEGRGILRSHQKLYAAGNQVGEITSGGFSPTLERSIALARIETGSAHGLDVEMRGKRLPVKVVKYPFVRHGKLATEL